MEKTGQVEEERVEEKKVERAKPYITESFHSHLEPETLWL